KIIFDMTDRCFKYQFYLGSGNYQKTSQSLHSP
ncbi:TPA: competence protein, partial [Streptococcus pyogenes]|nr:competence protein [Streptococcus pyogenes]